MSRAPGSRSGQGEECPGRPWVGVLVGDIGLFGGWSSSGFSVFGAGNLVSWGAMGLCLDCCIGFCIVWLVLSSHNKISS